MDRYSILQHHSTPPAPAGVASAPAAIDPSEISLRFLTEDEACSMDEMAHADLGAALQLLADRAQYITGATAAAIALRRKESNDMLCRASAGSNAPQLGSLLSLEHGLTGESVRTRQLQRCNNAQNDARVNREVCRRLEIASVLVMPILSGDDVIGVFELFSGKAYAFNEPDISALQRLSAMVEVAVKFAVTPQPLPGVSLEAAEVPSFPPAPLEQPVSPKPPSATAPVPCSQAPDPPAQKETLAEKQTPPEKTIETQPTPKQLFWSAPSKPPSTSAPAESPAPATSVPAVLRNLHKCEACGFPVSKGRTLCVECEEKQWRGRK